MGTRAAIGQALRFPFTGAAVVLALLVLIAAATTHINVISLPLGFLQGIESSELDELATSWLLVLVAFVLDQVLAVRATRRADGLEAEQVRVVHVTMRTVQDIVGNCLTELQLLRMEADGAVPSEALSLFDESIRTTSAKLQALGELKNFAEKQMAVGPGLEY